MSILGTRVLRTEDPTFLTVGGTYTADVRHPLLEGAAHLTYVRSNLAHGRIRSIETADAAAVDGVVAVLTAADLDLPPVPPPVPMLNQAMARPPLATDRVRFVGELLAAVVTDRPETGPDAAELVWADIDPLEAVVDPVRARTDEVLLFEEAGTNTAFAMPAEGDDPFGDCEVVVRARLRNPRLAACPLEVRSAAAAWGDDGRLHVWVSTQNPNTVQGIYAGYYGLDPSRVHVIAPDVGGGFGPKIGVYPEELLLPAIARHVGRPVRWTETRSENMVGMGHGRDQIQEITIGGRRDGTVLAYRLDVIQNAGAYPMLGAFLPFFTRMMAPGTYRIPTVQVSFSSVVTNTTPTVAYRGAGRPEATAAIERAMDLFAAEVGMDPAEVRRRNLLRSDEFPHTTPTGAVYDSGAYIEALDAVLAAAGYEELRAEQARRREAGDPVALGIGVSTYVEITAGPFAGSEYSRMEVHPDGSATVYTGTSPHGQGHATSFAMLAAAETGIPVERIKVVHGDTDLVPKGEGTMGSRSLQLGGSAVRQAAVEIVEEARRRAAELLEAAPEDVVLDTERGVFHVAGAPAVTRGWAEVAAAADPEAGLRVETEFQAPAPTFPFGAHVAVVEVDTETGQVRLVRHLSCDDAGRIINPLIFDGQRHGGIAQGAAQALLEEVSYDDDGNPRTANLADYGMISAPELPSFELIHQETPTPHNPLGVKGIGEAGTIGATPAVQSAVCDALAHLGVRHVDMPATPERVWRALREARDG